MGQKKNTEKKTTPAKAPRKTRAKMRGRKDSVAGHYADRLKAVSKQANDVMAKVAKFPGVAEAQEAGGLNAVVAELEKLAAANFAPPRGKGGRTSVQFAPGQKVTIASECVLMLKTLFVAAGIDDAEFFVSDSYTPQPKDRQIPLRVGGSTLDHPAVGFVSRKFVTAA